MTVLLDIRHQGQRIAEAKAASFELGVLKHRAIDVFEGRYSLEPATAGRGSLRMQLRYTALIGLRLPRHLRSAAWRSARTLRPNSRLSRGEVARRSSLPRPKPRTA